MGDQRFQRAKRIFLQAAELKPAQQAALLDQECAGDAALRLEVEAMLLLDSRSPDTSSSVAEALPLAGRAEPALPERIGRYRVLSKLGEGGFGVVYLAEQTEPVRRRVAVKVIKPGMDSARVIARFEAERQALAMMDHANIARVLDAGTTEPEQGSRPYFVMEHVAGEPITEYCDRHTLSVEERLGLFARVCEAIQHAHTKGVIHRDIKPSNVLVSVRQHEEPTAKVIDFGVAKALHQPLTERDAFTEQGQLIGTPEYMSPEQAEMGALDVDTRTDVYALGVLLYELLAGARPLDLRQCSLPQLVRAIREVEPPRPGTRLTAMGEAGTKIARARRTTVSALSAMLGTELEWVPLKAMRKDRTQRYQTVAALGADVRRYLDGIPLEAGPESGLYRARKFIGRHRAAVGAAATVAAALVLGLVGTSAATVWALRERDKAQAALARAESGERGEVDATRFVTNLLLAAGPAARGPDTTIADSLDHAARVLDLDADPDPQQAVQRRILLARAYQALHMGEQALVQTRLIHEARDAGTSLDDRAEGWLFLAEAGSVGDLSAALASCDRAIAAFSRAEAAPELGTARAQRSRTLARAGRLEEADAEMERAIALERAQPELRDDIAMLQAERAVYSAGLGRPDEARLRLSQALAAGDELAADNPYLRGALRMKAADLMLGPLDDARGAAECYSQAADLLGPIYPAAHPQIARLHQMRGMALHRAGDFAAADASFDLWQSLIHARRPPAPEPPSPDFVEAMIARAANHSRLGNYRPAMEESGHALTAARQLPDPESAAALALLASALDQRAAALRAMGNHEGAALVEDEARRTRARLAPGG